MFDQLLVKVVAEGLRQVPGTLHVAWGFFLANPLFCGLMIAIPVLGGLTSERRVPARRR